MSVSPSSAHEDPLTKAASPHARVAEETAQAGGANAGAVSRYEVALEALPERLRSVFVALSEDAATTAWLSQAMRRPHGRWKLAAKRLLDHVLSHYDANGVLDMYEMWLLSTASWRALLGERAHGRLLDVGAGDGRVTRELAPLFEAVEATETSRAMARRLRRRGYRCHEVDLARADGAAPGPFDVIAMLNVLDRSLYPRSLLQACVARLAPGGCLVVSVPLPLRPLVFVPGEAVHPEERLRVADESYEAALASLIESVLEPAGLMVRRFTRAPYFSRGDVTTPFYALDAALLVCERATRA